VVFNAGRVSEGRALLIACDCSRVMSLLTAFANLGEGILEALARAMGFATRKAAPAFEPRVETSLAAILVAAAVEGSSA
jgi:hypothetical protein